MGVDPRSLPSIGPLAPGVTFPSTSPLPSPRTARAHLLPSLAPTSSAPHPNLLPSLPLTPKHLAAHWQRQPLDGEPNLRAELSSYGIAQGRLRFADLLADIPAHLARTSVAHLMLDTLEYNCHTTGSDAIWAGVPSLSVAGAQMAARVGSSLLHSSATLSGLANSLRDYEAIAVDLTAAAKGAYSLCPLCHV